MIPHDTSRSCHDCRHFILGGMRGLDECGRVGHSCAWERAHDIAPSPRKEPNCSPAGLYFESNPLKEPQPAASPHPLAVAATGAVPQEASAPVAPISRVLP